MRMQPSYGVLLALDHTYYRSFFFHLQTNTTTILLRSITCASRAPKHAYSTHHAPLLPMPGGELREARANARHERRLEDFLEDDSGESSFISHVGPLERQKSE